MLPKEYANGADTGGTISYTRRRTQHCPRRGSSLPFSRLSAMILYASSQETGSTCPRPSAAPTLLGSLSLSSRHTYCLPPAPLIQKAYRGSWGCPSSPILMIFPSFTYASTPQCMTGQRCRMSLIQFCFPRRLFLLFNFSISIIFPSAQ